MDAGFILALGKLPAYPAGAALIVWGLIHLFSIFRGINYIPVFRYWRGL